MTSRVGEGDLQESGNEGKLRLTPIKLIIDENKTKMNLKRSKTATRETGCQAANGDPGSSLAQMPLVKQALIEFRQMTGLAAFLVPASASQKLVGFGKLEPDFCRQLATACEGGCGECYPTQRELFRLLDGKLRPQSVCCAGGMVQFAVPVVAGGRHLATVVGGKVRVRPAGNKQFMALADRLGLGANEQGLRELRTAYFHSPLLTPAKFRQAVRLLDVLARFFEGAIALRPAPIPAAESPHVVKARAYVLDHLGERVTTQQVARALNLNSSYFCRHFHRHTGVTFHTYLAQVRVEKAKARLLQSLDPITEICYVSGFQSVSDFNRVFKAKVGTTPSKFRGNARQPGPRF